MTSNHSSRDEKPFLKRKGPSIRNLLQVALIDSRALKSFLSNFLLAYNIRAGVALAVRALTLLGKQPRQILRYESLLGEKSLTFRVEAVRMGLFVGGFTGIFKAIVHSLHTYCRKRSNWHSAVGGWFAGLSLRFMDKSWHRTLALYTTTRAVQCFYNLAKSTGRWHFWGSNWKHGDSLLFILSSAQVMYAYVMRPETLPASYYRFIVRQGPIDEVILQAVRDNCRRRPIDLLRVMRYVRVNGGEAAVREVQKAGLNSDMPLVIPCRALHPYTKWCTLHSLYAFTGTVKRIFPVYLSLALVPAIVLRFKHFVKSPYRIISNSILSAMRSGTFLAAFCGSYQAAICFQRDIIGAFQIRDHKLWYYVAALVSGISILIEQKSRRSELALYAFPRAVESLYMILYDHKLAFSVPYGELFLFCAAMSSLMYFYENEEDCLSPLANKLLQRFVPKKRLSIKKYVSGSCDDENDSDYGENCSDYGENFSDYDENGERKSPGSMPSCKRVLSSVSLSGSFQIAP